MIESDNTSSSMLDYVSIVKKTKIIK
jgi:hypothetical protein